MNAKELARALAAATAEWELVAEAVAFPAMAEHLATCEAHGLWSGDAGTWSVARRSYLRRDLRKRLPARQTPVLAGPPAAKPLGAPPRRAPDTGVEAAS